MQITEIWDRIVCLLYPPRCVICDAVVEYDEFTCGKCSYVEYGRVKQDDASPIRDALAALEYTGPIRKIVWTIKDQALSGAGKRAVRFFAENMVKIAREVWPDIGFDCLVPIPSSSKKIQERGYNQAALLADRIGVMMGLPVNNRLLLRDELSPDQHTLSKKQRLRNAGQAFALSPTAGEHIAAKTLLLIDDVYTTGATTAACAEKLLSAGAKAVYVLTATITSHQDAANIVNTDSNAPKPNTFCSHALF